MRVATIVALVVLSSPTLAVTPEQLGVSMSGVRSPDLSAVATRLSDAGVKHVTLHLAASMEFPAPAVEVPPPGPTLAYLEEFEAIWTAGLIPSVWIMSPGCYLVAPECAAANWCGACLPNDLDVWAYQVAAIVREYCVERGPCASVGFLNEPNSPGFCADPFCSLEAAAEVWSKSADSARLAAPQLPISGPAWVWHPWSGRWATTQDEVSQWYVLVGAAAWPDRSEAHFYPREELETFVTEFRDVVDWYTPGAPIDSAELQAMWVPFPPFAARSESWHAANLVDFAEIFTRVTGGTGTAFYFYAADGALVQPFGLLDEELRAKGRLDALEAVLDGSYIHADGFESSDTSRWTRTKP